MKIISNFMGAALATSLLAGASMPAFADNSAAVVENYANIAQAKFEDSLTTVKTLDSAIATFLAAPTEANLTVAKSAWLASRVPYQQTEVYRFGNAIVDDWEGRVNAWPLDEGLIDYVDSGYGTQSDENGLYTANVIANKTLKIAGKEVDASKITPDFLQNTLQEAGGSESNVATGYHAIEFLLWGQDLNGNGAGNGARKATDYDTKNCTNGNCDRRGEYLAAASKLLVADLEEMVGNWTTKGAARLALSQNGIKGGLSTILTGMGSLSYGELAGERMKLGLLLHDPEEEHDCFSDNTHNSHLYDAVGIQNVYLGKYTRIDGSVVSGASLLDLVKGKDASVASELEAKLATTIAAMKTMVKRADSEAYDQMIGEGNTEGNKVVQAAIDGLVDQTKSIEKAIASLDLGGIELEGSDSLDKPNAVFE
ncbi:MAG: peptidase [Hyphomicrobiales bacterium]|nr:peptidase [Hyphomicrobiales bacterium]PCH49798.1 MAG: peptidase [Hyphomicrobiales bacterium]